MADPADTPPTPFHLDLHKWIEVNQTAHGVRHDDYAQYRAYCTKKLHRLSHQRDTKHLLVHSPKFATVKPAGGSGKPKRHAHCSRRDDTFAAVNRAKGGTGGDDGETKADNDAALGASEDAEGGATPALAVPHVNILWYLLVSAERSWAHANELQKSKGKRQTVLKKLKRAKDWAGQLLTMATSNQDGQPAVVDDNTLQEMEAYRDWMSANYAMEKMDYQTASQDYARAMALCYDMSEQNLENGPDTQRLERQDLFVSRADTLLRPLFRYCQYELKQAGQATMEEPTRPSAGIGEAGSSGGTAGLNPEDTIVFRGTQLVLDSKELRVVLLKLQSLEQEEEDEQHQQPFQEDKNGKETQFLTTLSALDDALDVVQSLQQGLGGVALSGQAVQAKLHQYALWKGYLEYTKTQKVMDHTEGLLVLDGENAMGHLERVHIYDALLQHAKSILALPRPGQDEGGVADTEEDEFGLQAQANILRLRALITFSMGFVYYENHKYANALALLEHSSQLCKRAREEIAACDEEMPHADDYLQEMEDLPLGSAIGAVRAAMALQQRQQARRMAKAGADPSITGRESLATDRPLLLRLYDLDGGTPNAPIADLRPIPVPCKPVFYDLAYNYALDPTESADKLLAFVEEHTVGPYGDEEKDDEAKPSSSLFGWLTGSSK